MNKKIIKMKKIINAIMKLMEMNNNTWIYNKCNQLNKINFTKRMFVEVQTIFLTFSP